MALTKHQVSEIRLRLNNGEKGCNLAKEFGVSNSYVSQIKSKKKGTKQVWLTVEEAERVKTFLDNAIELHDKGVVVIQSIGFETIQLINERIEKVGKQKC